MRVSLPGLCAPWGWTPCLFLNITSQNGATQALFNKYWMDEGMEMSAMFSTYLQPCGGRGNVIYLQWPEEEHLRDEMWPAIEGGVLAVTAITLVNFGQLRDINSLISHLRDGDGNTGLSGVAGGRERECMRVPRDVLTSSYLVPARYYEESSQW